MANQRVNNAPAGDNVVSLDERTLLARHVAGDTGAFPELMSRYRVQVFSYLGRCGIPEGTKDDVFQEIFFTIHRQARKYDAARPLGPWLFTIVANRVRDYFRKSSPERVAETAEGIEPQPSTIDGHDHAVARETADWLEDAMLKLPQIQRELILLTSKGVTFEAAAAATELPLGTVKTHIVRGRAVLARSLARRNAEISKEVRS